MAGNSTIAGPAATLLYVEDIGSSILMAAVKIHTGALGVDGGVVSLTNALPFRAGTPSQTNYATLAVNGQLIATGAAAAFFVYNLNTTGSSVFMQFFDATATQSNGAVPLQTAASNATANFLSTTVGHTLYGARFSTGIWMQPSTTLSSMTKLAASTANAGYVIWLAG